MDKKAMRKLTYGLFVFSVRCGKRDNACIVNTGVQVASSPDKIAVAVSKENFTSEMLPCVEDFSLSVISEDADFSLFQAFGFRSGRDVEKFDDFSDCKRVENGTLAVTKGTNGFLSAHIEQLIDLGSHLLVIGAVTDGEVFSDVPSATYDYYHKNIKPKPRKEEAPAGKNAWICRICGYRYEGEELPADIICPLCKHGADDFEKQ